MKKSKKSLRKLTLEDFEKGVRFKLAYESVIEHNSYSNSYNQLDPDKIYQKGDGFVDIYTKSGSIISIKDLKNIAIVGLWPTSMFYIIKDVDPIKVSKEIEQLVNEYINYEEEKENFDI